MELKHTPGEWELRGNKIFISGTSNSIATVHIQKSWDEQIRPIEDVESKANAKLIAAAPDLLEALKDIINCQYNPSITLAGLNGAISNARQLLNQIES